MLERDALMDRLAQLALGLKAVRSNERSSVLGSLVMVVCVTACTAKQPSDIDNVCAIFGEHRKWYKESQRAATGGAHRSQSSWRLSIRNRALKPKLNRLEQSAVGAAGAETSLR